MAKRTALYEEHVRLGAKIVDFAGWDMPLHYGSQIEEHCQVRRGAGMFDVSHMTISDLEGARAREFLRRVLANDIDKAAPGKAVYTCMLNEDGGVIDDLIVYNLGEGRYRAITNAATRDKDLAWIRQHAEAFGVTVREQAQSALIAVQGPEARDRLHSVLDAAGRETAEGLAPFQAAHAGDLFISRTGYTGEDGYEILLPAEQAVDLWTALYNAGVKPAGLGARDTLRLEAGMALYGTDMDESITPLEAGLAWTVAWKPEDRDFIGRAALEAVRGDETHSRLVGLVLRDRGVLRSHQKVYDGDTEAGEITSGSYSPFLELAIALARVAPGVTDSCTVDVRGRRLSADVVKPPFVRHGKSRIPSA